MLLGIAIGDAFGVAFELKTRKDIKDRFQFDHYDSGREGWELGNYSDDTQMSIAITELLLSQKKFNKINLANSFLEVYKRDPHMGYGSSVREALKIAKNAKEFLKIIPGNSYGNGACMRAVPIGILPDIKKVIQYAIINAKITHNSPSAIASSVCIATASHYFYYNLGKSENVLDYCIKACGGLDKESINYFESLRNMKTLSPALLFGKENENFGVSVNGLRTAGAVLYIVSRFYKNPAETLKEAILLGGDTDSVASICLGLVSIKAGLDRLPPFLLKGLENNGFGKDYLIKLGEKLFKLYPSNQF